MTTIAAGAPLDDGRDATDPTQVRQEGQPPPETPRSERRGTRFTVNSEWGGSQRSGIPFGEYEGSIYYPLLKIGEGGGGQVWLYLYQDGLEAWKLFTTAPKLEKPDVLPRRIQHPNVAEVPGFINPEGQRILRTKYVDGPSLDRLVRTQGVRTCSETAQIARAVADALHVAHSLPKSVLHLDIKPSNILWEPTERQPKIIDWGIAQLSSGEPRPVDGLTPSYAAPDLVVGLPQHDVYSLGATMHFLLTGSPPLPSEQPALLDSQPFLAPMLRTTMVRMLSPKHGDRQQSMRAVVDELDVFLALNRCPKCQEELSPSHAATGHAPQLANLVEAARRSTERRIVASEFAVARAELDLWGEAWPTMRPAAAQLRSAIEDCEKVLGEATTAVETLLTGGYLEGAARFLAELPPYMRRSPVMHALAARLDERLKTAKEECLQRSQDLADDACFEQARKEIDRLERILADQHASERLLRALAAKEDAVIRARAKEIAANPPPAPASIDASKLDPEGIARRVLRQFRERAREERETLLALEQRHAARLNEVRQHLQAFRLAEAESLLGQLAQRDKALGGEVQLVRSVTEKGIPLLLSLVKGGLLDELALDPWHAMNRYELSIHDWTRSASEVLDEFRTSHFHSACTEWLRKLALVVQGLKSVRDVLTTEYEQAKLKLDHTATTNTTRDTWRILERLNLLAKRSDIIPPGDKVGIQRRFETVSSHLEGLRGLREKLRGLLRRGPSRSLTGAFGPAQSISASNLSNWFAYWPERLGRLRAVGQRLTALERRIKDAAQSAEELPKVVGEIQSAPSRHGVEWQDLLSKLRKGLALSLAGPVVRDAASLRSFLAPGMERVKRDASNTTSLWSLLLEELEFAEQVSDSILRINSEPNHPKHELPADPAIQHVLRLCSKLEERHAAVVIATRIVGDIEVLDRKARAGRFEDAAARIRALGAFVESPALEFLQDRSSRLLALKAADRPTPVTAGLELATFVFRKGRVAMLAAAMTGLVTYWISDNSATAGERRRAESDFSSALADGPWSSFLSDPANRLATVRQARVQLALAWTAAVEAGSDRAASDWTATCGTARRLRDAWVAWTLVEPGATAPTTKEGAGELIAARLFRGVSEHLAGLTIGRDGLSPGGAAELDLAAVRIREAIRANLVSPAASDDASRGLAATLDFASQAIRAWQSDLWTVVDTKALQASLSALPPAVPNREAVRAHLAQLLATAATSRLSRQMAQGASTNATAFLAATGADLDTLLSLGESSRNLANENPVVQTACASLRTEDKNR